MGKRAGFESGYWLRVGLCAALLGLGTFALQWLDYRRMVRVHLIDVEIFAVAAGFLTLGLYLGARVMRPAPASDFDGNPRALSELGISTRELAVLEALAAGHSNKEIARRLAVSPNTVKTHVSRLLGKLEARRRTDAIGRARELGLIR